MLVAAALASGTLLLAADRAPSAAAQPTTLDVFAVDTTPGKTSEHLVKLAIAGGTAVQTLALHLPAGYRVDVAIPPATQIGTASVRFRSGSVIANAQGSIATDDPAKYEANTCVPGLHAGVWLLSLTLSGQAVSIPLYIDATPDVAARPAFVVQSCFDAPSVSGRQLASVSLDLMQGLVNPSLARNFVWRVLVTPYAADGTVDTTGTVEAQSMVPLPHRMTVRARYDKKRHRVTFTGKAVAGAAADRGTPVTIATIANVSLKPFGTTRTNAKGTFSFSKTLTQTTRFLVYSGDALFNDCEPTLGPAPCASETYSSSEFAAVQVTVPTGR